MNIYDATMIADDELSAEWEEYCEAYQCLIDTGIVWGLQGRFGRRAKELIEEGYCRAPTQQKA